MNQKNEFNGPAKIKRYSQATVPLEQGCFEIIVYRHEDGSESIAVMQGDLNDAALEKPVFTRVHSECFTGEVLGSLKCDCKQQLSAALSTIDAEGFGLVIYLRQEGRGIGLGNKIKAYELQNQGLNTIEANHALGFQNDLRDFKTAAWILRDLRITKIKLNTNNPEKISSLQEQGIEIVEVVPSITPVQSHNKQYLHTKYLKLGHKLGEVFPSESIGDPEKA
ncbi:MAG: GTP cyclohydrolase II [Oligoflexales bacterium]